MLLNNRQFLIKERIGLFKLSDTYDIHDPQTDHPIGIAKEEPEPWAKVLRLLLGKHFLPTNISVYEKENMPAVLSLRKKAALLRSTVVLRDANERVLGSFRSKLLSLGGAFVVFDALGNQIAEVQGDWVGWNFRFIDATGRELGLVTKKWGGFGKEMLTTADNYVIALHDDVAPGSDHAALLLAAGLAIDTVFKEK